MDKSFIEHVFNEFPHFSAMIIVYYLDINKVRKIVNKLINYKFEIFNDKLKKSTIECYLKGYLINPDSKRSYLFKEICNLNGLIPTLDDLYLEYYNAKAN